MHRLDLRIEIPYPYVVNGNTLPSTGEIVVATQIRTAAMADMRPVVVSDDPSRRRWSFDGGTWGPLSADPDIRLALETFPVRTKLPPEVASRLGLEVMSDVMTGPHPWSGMSRDMQDCVDPAWLQRVAVARETIGANLMSVDGTLYRRSGVPVLALKVGKGRFMHVRLMDGADHPEAHDTTCFGLDDIDGLVRFAQEVSPRYRLMVPAFEIADRQAVAFAARASFAESAARWVYRDMRRFEVGTFPAQVILAMRRVRPGNSVSDKIGAIVEIADAFGVDMSVPVVAMRPLTPVSYHVPGVSASVMAECLALVARRAATFPLRTDGDDDEDALGDLAF